MSQPKLPLYQCHKQVRAAEIISVDTRSRRVTLGLMPEEEGGVPPALTIMVEDSWLEKHEPKPGMWLVEYADGYRSVSPGSAFNDGYTPINEDDADHSWNPKGEGEAVQGNTSSDVKSPEAANKGGAGVYNDAQG